jgi:hypothetical protein
MNDTSMFSAGAQTGKLPDAYAKRFAVNFTIVFDDSKSDQPAAFVEHRRNCRACGL